MSTNCHVCLPTWGPDWTRADPDDVQRPVHVAKAHRAININDQVDLVCASSQSFFLFLLHLTNADPSPCSHGHLTLYPILKCCPNHALNGFWPNCTPENHCVYLNFSSLQLMITVCVRSSCLVTKHSPKVLQKFFLDAFVDHMHLH